MVTLHAGGSCTVACGTVDMGQGSDTAMAMIAAEVLRLPLGSIKIVHPDTDVTPYDMATLGSRSTYHMGNAVRRAAEDARDQLFRLAVTALKTDVCGFECRDAAVVVPGGARMTLRQIME